MGDVYTALSPLERAHVARVILFADAMFAPGDAHIHYLPAPLEGVGIKGARQAFPASPATVVESWCWDQDAVCQRPPHGHAFHGDIYDTYDTYEQLAATNAAHALA